MKQSKCGEFGFKKSRFVKRQKAKGILINLGVKALLIKIPLLNVYLKACKNEWSWNKVLLAGDKFMPELHLTQPEFTNNACGPFSKNKERIEKFMQAGNPVVDVIYRNEFDKACFQHDMVMADQKI